MRSTTFKVSLRIWHPSRTAEDIKKDFPFQPRIENSVNAQRRTPKGTLLTGVYRETYCSFPLSAGQGDFVDGLKDVAGILSACKGALSRIREEGGRCEVYVGHFSADSTNGFTIDMSTAHRMVDLSLDISVSIYGGPDSVEARNV
jgi:hypothetical protein